MTPTLSGSDRHPRRSVRSVLTAFTLLAVSDDTDPEHHRLIADLESWARGGGVTISEEAG